MILIILDGLMKSKEKDKKEKVHAVNRGMKRYSE
jgi:hypothetical protein